MNTAIFHLLCLIAITAPLWVYAMKTQKKPSTNTHTNSLNLSFEVLNKIIDLVVNEISEKYILSYKLREIQIIPNMDEEIKNISKEIVMSFSDEILREIRLYYTEEYFVAMITRKIQLLLIDYTDRNKPNTK